MLKEIRDAIFLFAQNILIALFCVRFVSLFGQDQM